MIYAYDGTWGGMMTLVYRTARDGAFHCEADRLVGTRRISDDKIRIQRIKASLVTLDRSVKRLEVDSYVSPLPVLHIIL